MQKVDLSIYHEFTELKHRELENGRHVGSASRIKELEKTVMAFPGKVGAVNKTVCTRNGERVKICKGVPVPPELLDQIQDGNELVVND